MWECISFRLNCLMEWGCTLRSDLGGSFILCSSSARRINAWIPFRPFRKKWRTALPTFTSALWCSNCLVCTFTRSSPNSLEWQNLCCTPTIPSSDFCRGDWEKEEMIPTRLRTTLSWESISVRRMKTKILDTKELKWVDSKITFPNIPSFAITFVSSTKRKEESNRSLLFEASTWSSNQTKSLDFSVQMEQERPLSYP